MLNLLITGVVVIAGGFAAIVYVQVQLMRIVSALAERKAPISSAFESDALTLLRSIDEKTKPPAPAPFPPDKVDAQVTAVVEEAYDYGESYGALNAKNGHPVTGPDKQREAVRFAQRRLEALTITNTSMTEISQRIEAEVARRRSQS